MIDNILRLLLSRERPPGAGIKMGIACTYLTGANLSRQLFGTDGIRGVAGEAPLDKRTAFALGTALGQWARGLTLTSDSRPEVLIGMDTRESSPWLAEHVAGGLAESGVSSRFAGVITTPGVAYLTR